MRPASNLLQLAVCLSSVAPLAAAWPNWFPPADSVVVRRVAHEASTLTFSPTRKQPLLLTLHSATGDRRYQGSSRQNRQ